MKVLISPLALFGGLLLFGIFGGNKVFGATVLGLTRTHSGAGVTVKVTYLNPKETESVRFEVVLDTHSVNLDGYDLKTLALLRDETGKELQPTQVENKGSGHHREFFLTFPKPSDGANRLELVIKNIARVKERPFRWELQ